MDDRNKTKVNIVGGINMDGLLRNLKLNMLSKLFKDNLRQLGNHGSYRSAYYMCPSNFYNHGSRTFLKNKRRGL